MADWRDREKRDDEKMTDDDPDAAVDEDDQDDVEGYDAKDGQDVHGEALVDTDSCCQVVDSDFDDQWTVADDPWVAWVDIVDAVVVPCL